MSKLCNQECISNYFAIVLFTFGTLVILYTILKTKSMKYEKFQIVLILLYLFIFIEEICQSINYLAQQNQKDSNGYHNAKFIFLTLDSIFLMLSWILNFLQVIFACRLMIIIQSDSQQAYQAQNYKLRLIKNYMVSASIFEACFSLGYKSIMFYYQDNQQVMVKANLTLILSLLNLFSTIFSISVDFIMYPMFFIVFKFFHTKSKQKLLKLKQNITLKKKLIITMVVFLFSLNLVHSILTHTTRILLIINPYYFQEFQKNNQEVYYTWQIVAVYYFAIKNCLMGMSFTYLSYFLTKISNQSPSAKSQQFTAQLNESTIETHSSKKVLTSLEGNFSLSINLENIENIKNQFKDNSDIEQNNYEIESIEFQSLSISTDLVDHKGLQKWLTNLVANNNDIELY